MKERIDQWLTSFTLDQSLHEHIAAVVLELPAGVRDDLMDDPAFVLWDYDPIPRAPVHVPIRLASGRRARSVVLKRTLRRRPAEFIRWVIAHELAHAHLHNAGRWPEEDPELAADALASDWGFPKPRVIDFFK